MRGKEKIGQFHLQSTIRFYAKQTPKYSLLNAPCELKLTAEYAFLTGVFDESYILYFICAGFRPWSFFGDAAMDGF